MEHSALHAFELVGQVIALGGVFLVVGLIQPAVRALAPDDNGNVLSLALQSSVERWIFRGALIAAAATFLDLLVEVAEAQGKTVFGGLHLNLLEQFATETTVGRLELARIVVLLLTAGATQLRGSFKWWLIGLGAFGAIFLTSMVSHSAARPTGRWLGVTAQVAHITTAALWLGILAQLLGARSWIQGKAGRANAGLVAEIVLRFSPLALTVTSLLALSGLFMVVRLAGGLGGLLTSAYGLTLLVKMTLLAPALVA
ncbi:MAG: Copper resistance domain protein, partial [Pedosphaera sp.]|nr:Copper resistance domain protein [Pedosphaera sp.]